MEAKVPTGFFNWTKKSICGGGDYANYSLDINITCNLNDSNISDISDNGTNFVSIFMAIMYGLICTIGLLGNGLVIFVITRYTKMKTVTNLFILNLSIADSLFLFGLPMIMVTSLLRSWIFGEVMCKIYYILTCINWFTGAFTLTMMSGDRFLAVCYPLTSMKFRTPKYAIFALILIWSTSLIFMIPVMIFSKLNHSSCVIQWSTADDELGPTLFLIYTLLLGFIIPVSIITILYALLITRLRNAAPSLGISGKRRSHTTKVTKLVTLIITVFIICWLPYWCFQVYLNFRPSQSPLTPWLIHMFQGFTILSYANSMINPMLYAFTNENFRESFMSAFKCAADPVLGYPRSNRRNSEYVSLMVGPMKRLKSLRYGKKKQEDYEFTVITNYALQPNGDIAIESVDTNENEQVEGANEQDHLNL